MDVFELPTTQWVKQKPNPAWEKVRHLGQEKSWKPKQVLHRPSDPVGGIALLLSGVVRVMANGPGGQSRTLWFMGPGGILGEAALFHNKRPYMHNIIAVQKSRTLEFSTEVVFGELLKHPEISLALLENLAVKSYIASTQLEESSFQDAYKKLTRFIHQYYSVDAEGMKLLSQQTVADLLGLHRVTVSKLLGRLKQEGVLAETKRGLLVRDPDKLAALI